MNAYKKRLASIGGALKLSHLGLLLQRIVFANKYIRAVNYHCTPKSSQNNFEKQLYFFKDNFVSVNQDILGNYLSTGYWDAEKPGLIISFDDSLRSNYDVAAPILEHYGFTGWFMVNPGLINTPPDNQRSFALNQKILDRNATGDVRIGMSWEEVLDLSKRKHEICSHTYNHVRLAETVPPDEVKFEVEGSKKSLEAALKRNVSSFAWVGGEEQNYGKTASNCLRKAGYAYSFNSNAGHILPATDRFMLGRVNLESDYSMDLVMLQLSGLIDLLYTAKRRRLNSKVFPP